MDERRILEGLAELGVRPEHWRLVLLLPLVQVAWADGVVQVPERTRIVAIAQASCVVDEASAAVLDGWLRARPSDAHLLLGRRVLVALAHRQRGIGADLDASELDRVVDLCLDVARAAGGILGVAFTVSPEERAAIAEITAELGGGSDAWRDLLPGSDRLQDL